MSATAGAGGFGDFRRYVNEQKQAGRKIVLMEFPQASHISYYAPVITRLRSEAPDVIPVVMYARHLPTRGMLDKVLRDHGFGDLFVTDRWNVGCGAHLYLSTNQFTPGLIDVYSVCFFHGQPSKGITFNRRALETYDAFFFYGPLHHKALERYLRRHGTKNFCPRIVETGYPKTDPLFDGSLSRERIRAGFGFSVDLPTVLYAPAFNEHASLRTAGREIVERLSRIEGINVLIKLAGHTIENTVRGYSTGGVDWPALLRAYENDRLKLVLDPDINPCLVAADIMLTDVSGVAWDFLALRKPVVYWDCPEFYRKHAAQFDGSLTLEECLSDESINAGRSHGMVVASCDELERAINRLKDGGTRAFPLDQNLADQILFNRGNATVEVVKSLLYLVRSDARPAKPHNSWLRDVWLPTTARRMGGPLLRGLRKLLPR